MKAYSNLTVFFHWLLLPIILIALFMGNDIAQLSNDLDLKVDRLQVHMGAGVLIGLLFMIRFGVRLLQRTPRSNLNQGKVGLMNRLGKLVHKTLYFLVFLIILSGLVIAAQVDFLEIVAAGETMPESLSSLPIRMLHGTLTSLLVVLILLHMLAALFHQFILKDQIFSKMWFRR